MEGDRGSKYQRTGIGKVFKNGKDSTDTQIEKTAVTIIYKQALCVI